MLDAYFKIGLCDYSSPGCIAYAGPPQTCLWTGMHSLTQQLSLRSFRIQQLAFWSLRGMLPGLCLCNRDSIASWQVSLIQWCKESCDQAFSISFLLRRSKMKRLRMKRLKMIYNLWSLKMWWISIPTNHCSAEEPRSDCQIEALGCKDWIVLTW